MILIHPILLIFYAIVAVVGIIYFLTKLIKKTTNIISGNNQPKSWFQQELNKYNEK